jgi:hypothetical protein
LRKIDRYFCGYDDDCNSAGGCWRHLSFIEELAIANKILFGGDLCCALQLIYCYEIEEKEESKSEIVPEG